VLLLVLQQHSSGSSSNSSASIKTSPYTQGGVHCLQGAWRIPTTATTYNLHPRRYHCHQKLGTASSPPAPITSSPV
jgi:hypothetical protein